MQLSDITCWLFTESRFREANPFSRFEDETLEALDDATGETDPELNQRLRKLILERTEQIFESDLSWGQNLYSRDNLRWVSFIAGYSLTMRESLDDHAPHLRRLEERIHKFGNTRLFPLWVLITWTIIHLRRNLPARHFVRKISMSAFLRVTHLPFTSRSNWIGDRNSFYERFFSVHSCPEMCEAFAKMGRRWKCHVPSMDLT